ncbi:MAG: V-type ATP synthase subunit E [candidate division WOR-3 bacterium]|nr:MAG: V-type ATP synthase subunit E [candidate division WOR-3 bacterium]
MSTQKVIDKILEDAKKDAEEITLKYKKEASSIAGEFDEQIAQKQQRIKKEIEERRETHIMRTISQRRLTLNMKQTEHRWNLIRKIIDEAVAKLPEHTEYLTFLKNLIKKSGEREGELLLSKHDFSRYRSDLEKFLRSEKINLKVNQDSDITAGVIIKRGTANYIGSLDIILELLSDELAIAISKKLS